MGRFVIGSRGILSGAVLEITIIGIFFVNSDSLSNLQAFSPSNVGSIQI